MCNACYGTALAGDKTERWKSLKPIATSETTSKPEQTQPQPTKPSTSKKKPKTGPLERQVPRVAEFFREAGVPISSNNNGWVVIDGERAFKADRAQRSAVYWDNLINRLVLAHCPDRFIDALTRNGAVVGENIKAFYDPEEHGFDLMREDVELAFLTATRARVYGGDSIAGNYLQDGEHWRRLAAEILRVDERRVLDAARDQESRASDEPQQQWVLVTEPPTELEPALVQACLEASEDIRLHRSIAYPQTVVLDLPGAELRLQPIARSNSGVLTAPFDFHGEGEAVVTGSIVLGGASHPLRVRFGADVPESPLARAWAAAFLGLAAATCFATDDAPLPRATPTARPGLRGRRRRTVNHPGSGVSIPRRRFWPQHLEPVGHWTRRGASFVPGHRRRLFDGRQASAEARDRALAVGINLRANETWVQPHTRGLGETEELTFRWAAPDLLVNQR